MKAQFYKILIWGSKNLGVWFFHVVARGIAFGYFIFFPKRVAIQRRFFKALLPQFNTLYHLLCVWRQFQSFTTVFLDRFIVDAKARITYSFEGLHYLETAMENKKGGIILMSHVGNWEIAAHFLMAEFKTLPLLLLMGRRHKEEIEAVQKMSLKKSGVRILATDEKGGSPFDIVEAVNFIKEGGFVSLTGDRVWRGDQRAIPVSFLGHRAYLPEIPYVLALVSKAPIWCFFTQRIKESTYHFSLSDAIHVQPMSRSLRRESIVQAAKRYAIMLENAVKRSPSEWYHFERFIHENKKFS